MPLNGTESAADHALVYHMTTAKIDTEGHHVPFRTHLSVLVSILCLSSGAELTIEEINRTYEDQLWNPDNWTVRSFHDNIGTALPNAVTVADSRILKTVGSL